jgi:hypothetical protein
MGWDGAPCLGNVQSSYSARYRSDLRDLSLRKARSRIETQGPDSCSPVGGQKKTGGV